MKNYEELAKFIVSNVGGIGNVVNLTHCMTRLRFELKDNSSVNKKVLNQRTEVISVNEVNGEIQIIVGNSVDSVYDSILDVYNLKIKKEEVKGNKENIISRLIKTITKIITPILGALIAISLIKGVLALLVALGLVTSTDGGYILINAIGDSLFYFFPVILGYTAAETFGLNKFSGMLLGAILIYPGLQGSFTSGETVFSIFTGTPFELSATSTFFGIPIMFPMMGYQSTVVPIILITFVSSKVEKFLKSNIPDIVGFAFVPFLTLLICAPLGILTVGPIANLLSAIISWITTSLFGISSILAAAVVAMIYQPLVIFGLHWPLIMICINNMGTMGYDYLWPVMFSASFAQTAVVAAVGVKTRDKRLKAASIPAMISGMMCIIEPAIYGFTLPVKKRFLISMVSATIGGLIITIFNARIYAITTGVLGYVGFINPNGDVRNMIIAVIATLVTMIVAFILTIVTFSENPDAVIDDEKQMVKQSRNPITLLSPAKGKLVNISEVHDDTFKSEVLGKSAVIIPEEGKIVSPVDGEIKSFFSTGHALGIVSDEGLEILIHVGIDTINLEGKYFTKKAEIGDRVRKGQVLLEFDNEKIVNDGYSMDTVVVITNSRDYENVYVCENDSINYLGELMKIS